MRAAVGTIIQMGYITAVARGAMDLWRRKQSCRRAAPSDSVGLPLAPCYKYNI